MTYPVSNIVNTVATGGTSTAPFITIFEPRDPTSSDRNYLVSQRWLNTSLNKEWILIGFTSSGGVVNPNWQLLSAVEQALLYLTGNNGEQVPPTDANINILGDGTTIDVIGNPSTSTLTISYIGSPGGVTSINATAPLKANGVSGSPETGAITLALATPLTGQYGGTGINNAGLTIDLAYVGTGYVLTSDSSGNATWQASSVGSVTFTGDTGTPFTTNSVTIYSNQASNNCGSSVGFYNDGTSISLLQVSDSNLNTILGNGSGNSLISGQYNTQIGAVSYTALNSGNNNCSVGVNSLVAIQSGSSNCTIGYSTAPSLVSGSFNLIFGDSTGSNYSLSESNNILLNSYGVTSESNTLHIGSGTGTGTQQLNAAFISGITSNTQNPSSSVQVVTIQNGSGASPDLLGVTNALTSITLNPDTDQGSPVSGSSVNVNAFSDPNYPNNCGSSVWFFGDTATSPQTLLLNVTDQYNNTIIGLGSGNSSITSSDNTCLGHLVLANLSGGSGNTHAGSQSGTSLIGGNSNTGCGYYTLQSSQNDNFNTAIGWGALTFCNGGSFNVAVGGQANNQGSPTQNVAIGTNSLINNSGTSNNGLGFQSFVNLSNGSYNIGIGDNSGNSYSTTESNNICINSSGVTAESNTLHIGNGTGTGTKQLNAAYISGITSNSQAAGTNVQFVTIQTSGGATPDLLGITPTSGIIDTLIVDGDNGSASPSGGTITIYAGYPNNCGASVQFNNSGSTSTLNVTDTNDNTMIGLLAGQSIPMASLQTATYLGKSVGVSCLFGSDSTAVGAYSLTTATNSSDTVAIGSWSLKNITQSSGNTAVGSHSGYLLNGTASYNCLFGYYAGSQYTTSESNNICLNSAGSIGESNVLRIGNGTGTGSQQLNAAYISGITSTSQSLGTNVQLVTIQTSGGATPDLLGTTTASGIVDALVVDGDTGTASPSGGTITIYAGYPSNCGASVQFNNSGSTSTLNVTDTGSNTMIGLNAGQPIPSAVINYVTCLGKNALSSFVMGSDMTGVGYYSMSAATSGSSSVGIGSGALKNLVTSYNNTAVGFNSGYQLSTSATGNTFLGVYAGGNYTTGESNNICISNQGVIGDSGVIRIGTSGTQNSAYVSGITNTSQSPGTNVQIVTIQTSGGASPNLVGITPASGIVDTLVVDGDSGSATPSAGAITISGGTTGLTTSGSGSTLDLTGTLNVANGGTGQSSLTSGSLVVGNGTSPVNFIAYQSTGGSPAGGSSNIVARDSNGNTAFNNSIDASASNAAGGTVTLTEASAKTQIFSGTGASTLVLPVATTLINGWTFYVNNNSNSTITVQYQDTTTFITVPRSAYVQIILTSNGSSNGSWDYHWLLPASSSNGQLMIGSGTTNWEAATLTAGSGISITNGSNSITIASTVTSFTWSDTSGTVTASAQNGYFITGVTISTLPSSPNEGDTVKYIVDTSSSLTITAAGTQKIRVANTLSAAGGTTVNTQQGDAMTLVYRTSDTTWLAENFIGAWTTT